ncbi:MAG: ATPase, T2SS/T4P/T4SS family, partial [Armatimonadota bacterium]
MPSSDHRDGALHTLKNAVGLPDDSLTLERAFRFADARAAVRAGRMTEARDAYLHLAELDGDEPWVHWDLATIFRALELRGEAGLAYLTAADKHLARGETDQVFQAYQQAAAVSPNDPQVQAKLAEPPTRPAPPNGGGPGVAVRQPPVAPPSPPKRREKPPVEPAAPPADAAGAADGAPPPARPPRARAGSEALGTILVSMGIVTEGQLAAALEVQGRTGERLGHILRDMGVVSDVDLARGMAEQWGYPYITVGERRVDAEVAKLIPQALARRHKCIAVEKRNGRVLVAIADPLNVIALDDVRLITGMEVDVAVSTEDEIATALARSYQITDTDLMERVLRESSPEFGAELGSEDDPTLEQLKALVEEAPVVKLVNLIIDEAVKQSASDIHIEPQRGQVWIRYRVDGVLRDVMNPPKHLKAALVSRMKIMADMDIAERRKPQDGRIHLVADGHNIDLRVSTLPTMFGEKVVMRILDQSSTMIGLTKLGFPSDTLRQWENAAAKPYGFLLVTGPTGSGKTTTLYGTLSKLNTMDKNIVTVEDPVEYQIPRINQVQVNAKAGLTFANGLRSILRQDPDIVLVGEIRDQETGQIAIQASLTGHLVLSTLHTNDAAGAITRLVDMGIEPFLISSSLIGVLAQRLARVICTKCKVAYSPP